MSALKRVVAQPLEILEEDASHVYSPFRLYKWAIILFNIALLYEFVIVLGFWCIILPGILFATAGSSHDNSGASLAFIIVAGVLDHSLPMVVLAVEFAINCMPIIWRHFIISISIGIIYMTMNMIYSLEVAEVYPVIDWKSVLGISVPISMLFFTVFIKYVLVKCHKKKLKINRKTDALEQLDKLKDVIKVRNIV